MTLHYGGMKKIKKTLYFDIKTVAKIQKIQYKFTTKKKRLSESEIAEAFIKMTPMDQAIAYLNADMKLADKLPLNRM